MGVMEVIAEAWPDKRVFSFLEQKLGVRSLSDADLKEGFKLSASVSGHHVRVGWAPVSTMEVENAAAWILEEGSAPSVISKALAADTEATINALALLRGAEGDECTVPSWVWAIPEAEVVQLESDIEFEEEWASMWDGVLIWMSVIY